MCIIVHGLTRQPQCVCSYLYLGCKLNVQEVYSRAKVDKATMNGAHHLAWKTQKKASCSKVSPLGCVNGNRKELSTRFSFHLLQV